MLFVCDANSYWAIAAKVTCAADKLLAVDMQLCPRHTECCSMHACRIGMQLFLLLLVLSRWLRKPYLVPQQCSRRYMLAPKFGWPADRTVVFAVFSYLAEQCLRRRNNPSMAPLATATANLTKTASLSKTAQPQMAPPMPAVGSDQTAEPVVVNLRKGKKKSSQRFAKCSS